jgi:hypothetical protein
VPLTCWCFGYAAPVELRCQRDGRAVEHWYTDSLEHIHTLPEAWHLPDDDFERVLRWHTLGVDDVIDVSPPWSAHPSVRWRDWQEPPSSAEPYVRLCREYETPAGKLLRVVRRTDEHLEPGWEVQPDDDSTIKLCLFFSSFQ